MADDIDTVTRAVEPPREIGEIVGLAGLDCVVHGAGDRLVTHIATLDETRDGSLAFCRSEGRQAVDMVAATASGCSVLVGRGGDWAPLGDQRTVVETDYPRLLFVELLRILFESQLARDAGIHAAAIVDASAKVGEGTSIGPLAVVEAGATIGDECVIHAGAVIRSDTEIGSRCTVEANAVVGSDGQASELDLTDRHVWMPHLGKARIGADVRIGANATVVRGTLRDTVIERGATIGNQANIGHNAHIGEDVFIGVGAMIAGSCRLDDGVWIGPGAAVLNGVRIGSRALVAIGAVVTRDVPGGKMSVGNPAKTIAKLGALNDSRKPPRQP